MSDIDYASIRAWLDNWPGPLKLMTGETRIVTAHNAAPVYVRQLLDRVEELEATLGRVREAVEEAHAHRFDLDDTTTAGPGKPAVGPDIFYNGIGYVVRRVRAALTSHPAAEEEKP